MNIMKRNIALEKCPTGIEGFDEITFGGLPKGRATLICGPAGSGKSLFCSEFLVKGIIEHDEPGVLLSFEERAEDILQNLHSFDWPLDALIESGKLNVDHIHIDSSEIIETGVYNLDGLFIRIGQAIDAVSAKRVAIDTIETLFGAFQDTARLRSEFKRLCNWLQSKGVTVVISTEKGEGNFTRYGIEEYVTDCVLSLDNRVLNEIATRRIRIVKYRGSSHGLNEYPFLISNDCISILPLSSISLDYEVSSEKIPTGIGSLDKMLDEGYYRGSSILVSGTSGTGKTSIGVTFARTCAERNELVIYFSFEESSAQIIRDMQAININLQPFVDNGTFIFHNVRSTTHSLEMHLSLIQNIVNKFKPAAVIIDPASSLISGGTPEQVKSLLSRMIDYFKARGITAMFINLTPADRPVETTESTISSMMDTWILLRNIEQKGERKRGLYILKSRGMNHSNETREFLITNNGIDILNQRLLESTSS